MTNEDRFIKTLKGVQYVVINTCYGGFGLSEDAISLYKNIARVPDISHYDIARDDPVLVQVVRTLDKDANGHHALLKIVEVPGDVEWEIAEYDGKEWVAEVHRTWK